MILLLLGSVSNGWSATEFKPGTGDRIVVLGGTFAERLQHSGYFETLLQIAYPRHRLSVRNMGWSGDTVDLMPRPHEFGELEAHLERAQADAILLCFGANESFAGKAGLDAFRVGMERLIERLQAKRFNGETVPRLAVVSPIAQEDIGGRFPDPRSHNHDLEKYSRSLAEVAKRHGLPFLDLFKPTRSRMRARSQLTVNGIHLNDRGYRVLAEDLTKFRYLGAFDKLRNLVVEKNRQFFLRWRPVNGEYVYGRRKSPFGVLSYPPEMEQLDKAVGELDEQIWTEARRLAGNR